MSKIDLSKLVLNRKDDFIFNLLNIENFNTNKSAYQKWYKHLIQYGKKIEGDIFEFGTYQGKSLIAIAILCKKLKINKTIYGFDSFRGFPKYHKFDSLNYFNKKYFNKKLIYDHKINLEIRKFLLNKNRINEKNISTSGSFKASKKELIRKINLLKLDNIKLIEGDFKKTVPEFFLNYNNKIFSANVDCDLYEGYCIALEHIIKRLAKKGFIHLDEYYSLKFPGAKIATDTVLKKNKIKLKFYKKNSHEFKRYYLLNE
jgi:hypothetical protein